jgi:hypothetical protein
MLCTARVATRVDASLRSPLVGSQRVRAIGEPTAPSPRSLDSKALPSLLLPPGACRVIPDSEFPSNSEVGDRMALEV